MTAEKSFPRHVAVIMDGNGRWAERRGLPRLSGHKKGFEAFLDLVDNCHSMGIEYLTVYAFSTENWKRSAEEVKGLMNIMTMAMKKYISALNQRNIRCRVIGDMSFFDDSMRRAISESTAKTASNTGMELAVAVSYGGRNEITRALKKLLEQELEPTEENISKCLDTAGMPDPDLVIRTSGELRTSNFLLWQSAYSEYWITDVLWPDFGKKELEEAFAAYAARNRRFGGR